jgi:hypothetical protein
MIIKGSTRGQSSRDAAALARHLLAVENEEVAILQLRGVVSTRLPDTLEEMRLLTLGTRARRGLYHASINLDRDEAPELGTARWLEAADELERRLGMQDHQRAVVRHVKRGRAHVHIVWCRAHPVTLTVARDSQNYRKHEECARALESCWRLRPVTGVHTRHRGTPRPVALARHGDWQAQERTGIAVAEVAAALQTAWASAWSGQAFAAAIQHEGLTLARGRRGIVAVDGAGTPHSLPRRLRLTAAEVRQRLADINVDALPAVEDIKQAVRRPKRKGRKDMTKAFGACEPRRQHGGPSPAKSPSSDYWRQLGFEVEAAAGALLVNLSGGTVLHDRGDRLTLVREGEPTDEEIRLIVTAGRARGWESIRFFGGRPEFQRRARLEALRQGYRLDQISLECEDGSPQPLSASMPMPEHIRRRLSLPEEPVAPAAPAGPTEPAPGDGVRP